MEPTEKPEPVTPIPPFEHVEAVKYALLPLCSPRGGFEVVDASQYDAGRAVFKLTHPTGAVLYIVTGPDAPIL